jgi:hypothetical protein
VSRVVAPAGGSCGAPRRKAEEAPPPLESRGVVTFEPFLVNLADAGGRSFF